MTPPKIKRARTSTGKIVLIGRDDRSNDHLTFSVAAPNDLWFHIAGFPGSHVVLKTDEGEDKDSVKEAAAACAFYSKMKNATKVSVSYCPVKNVSKPKGVKAGSVRVKSTKKIIVKPQMLLEEEA